jgi:hypothetical protein
MHLAFNLIIGIGPMIALNLVLTGINSYYLLANHRKSMRAKASSRRRQPARRAGLHRASVLSDPASS